MQDRFVGDIGDFGKYGLLRALCWGYGGERLRLGVNWYLVSDQGNPGDGGFIDYLHKKSPQDKKKPKTLLEMCDPELFSLLREIVFPDEDDFHRMGRVQGKLQHYLCGKCYGAGDPGKCLSKRCIAKVELQGILPGDTLFYSRVLDYPQRGSWVKAGYDFLRDCDLVFFDPDNGLQVNSVCRHEKMGVKYVFDDEAGIYYGRGQSLIIYQHRSMEPENIYLARIKNSISNITGREKIKTIRLRYRRGSARDFLIIPNHHCPGHGNLIETRIDAMLQTAWSNHFIKYYL
ncbi:MAG: hypothetical protein ACOX7L_03210 [Dethiobacteria bacterium]|jgi:hypothetical protein